MNILMESANVAFYNFPATMTVLALVIALLCGCCKKNCIMSDIFLKKLMFFAVGLTGLWGFAVHAFFPAESAKFIGWVSSPFQLEVAGANLGMGLAGIFGCRATQPYRVATTIFTTCFLWTCAFGHIMQMKIVGNYAMGNAGPVFYNDILLPLLLIFFLSRNKRSI